MANREKGFFQIAHCFVIFSCTCVCACSSWGNFWDNNPNKSGTQRNPSIFRGGSVQGNALSLAGTAGAYAGLALTAGQSNGTGATARFNNPGGITTDGTYLFVSDSSNNTVRRISITAGTVDTLAGTAPTAGTADGTGSSASFSAPGGITTDGTYLYNCDYGSHIIRRTTIATAVVTTIAGSALVSGTTDAVGNAARFTNPNGITTDETNLYVADRTNHLIRKIIIATGEVSTLAGQVLVSGSADGTGGAAQFNHPYALTTDGHSLYIAEFSNHTVRRLQ